MAHNDLVGVTNLCAHQGISVADRHIPALKTVDIPEKALDKWGRDNAQRFVKAGWVKFGPPGGGAKLTNAPDIAGTVPVDADQQQVADTQPQQSGQSSMETRPETFDGQPMNTAPPASGFTAGSGDPLDARRDLPAQDNVVPKDETSAVGGVEIPQSDDPNSLPASNAEFMLMSQAGGNDGDASVDLPGQEGAEKPDDTSEGATGHVEGEKASDAAPVTAPAAPAADGKKKNGNK